MECSPLVHGQDRGHSCPLHVQVGGKQMIVDVNMFTHSIFWNQSSPRHACSLSTRH
jgi:hypothetical protein